MSGECTECRRYISGWFSYFIRHVVA